MLLSHNSGTVGVQGKINTYNLLNLKKNLVGTAGFEPTTTTPPVLCQKHSNHMILLNFYQSAKRAKRNKTCNTLQNVHGNRN